jgi:hypothetical protein
VPVRCSSDDDNGEEFAVEERGAFDDVEDIIAPATTFTPACASHPLAPIAGPIVVRGANPGDLVAIDLIELTPFVTRNSALLDFGGAAPRVLRADGILVAGARRSHLVQRTAFHYRSIPISALSRRCRTEGY